MPRPIPELPVKEIVEKLYWEQGLSSHQLAEKFNCSHCYILSFMKSHNITRRSFSEGYRLNCCGKGVRRRRRLAYKEKHYRYRENHPNWKQDYRYKDKDNYILIRVPDDYPYPHKKPYIYEHRLIWEQVHNRTLPLNYDIHHINGIKTDNRPQNLIAIPHSKHTQQHINLNETRKRKIRELEAENAQLRRALESSQMIFTISEN